MEKQGLSDIGRIIAKHIRIAKCVTLAVGIIMAGSLLWAVLSGALGSFSALRLSLAALALVVYSALVVLSLKVEWSLGIVPPVMLSALLFGGAFFAPMIFPDGPWWLRAAAAAVAAVAALCILLFAGVMLAMLAATLNRPAKGEWGRYTLVVLGSRLVEGKPGRKLIGRMEKALQALRQHPECCCILSGGAIEEGEPAEADVMQQWMLDHGAEAGRIFAENRSRTTYENIRFSKALAKAQDLPLRFAIVTDGFHQLRAGLICRDNGVEHKAVSARTPADEAVQHWFYEVFCLLEKWLKRL